MTGFEEKSFFSSSNSVMTGHKLECFLRRSSASPRKSILRTSTRSYKNFSPTFIPEYICDVWTDKSPKNRVSIQFRLDSGHRAHQELNIRVSTDGLSLTLTKNMSDVALYATKGVKGPIAKRNPSLKADPKLLDFFDNHTRMTARRQAVAKIFNREAKKGKKIELEARLPLPFKCHQKIATAEDGDEFFHGINFNKFDDGSVWCTVELIAAIHDGYQTLESYKEEVIFDIPENKTTISASERSLGSTIAGGSKVGVPSDISFSKSIESMSISSATKCSRKSAAKSATKSKTFNRKSCPSNITSNFSYTTTVASTPESKMGSKIVDGSVFHSSVESPSQFNTPESQIFTNNHGFWNTPVVSVQSKQSAQNDTNNDEVGHYIKVRSSQRLQEKNRKSCEEKSVASHTSKCLRLVSTKSENASYKNDDSVSQHLRKLKRVQTQIENEINEISKIEDDVSDICDDPDL